MFKFKLSNKKKYVWFNEHSLIEFFAKIPLSSLFCKVQSREVENRCKRFLDLLKRTTEKKKRKEKNSKTKRGRILTPKSLIQTSNILVYNNSNY